MKRCLRCKEEKDLIDFSKDKNKKDGLNINCRSCCKLLYNRYREDNKEKESERGKIYNKQKRIINKDLVKEYKKEYFQKNKELIAIKRRNKYNINKDIINQKRRDDIPKRLNNIIGSLIRSHLKGNGFDKKLRTYEIIGCSPIDLKIYLELKFEDWMTWENRGLYNGELNYGWDIDHIIPISSAKTEDEILKLNHYTNLQPLCSYTNRYIKINKVDFLK